MIGFPEMLVGAAVEAGIEVPEDAANFEDYKNSNPHFYIFCALQLGKRVREHGEHFENAKVIAMFDEESLKTARISDFEEKGFQF